jgi:hypothetical protein
MSETERARAGLAAVRPDLARRLASLSEHAQIAAVLAQLARDRGVGELVTVLAAALDDHREGRDPLGGRVLLAAVGLLSDQGSDVLSRSLLDEASGRGLGELAHFLESPPPLLLEEVRKAQVLQGKDGRPLTLGERKSLARNPGRFEMDRLLADPSSEVVRNLLSSPKLTEDDVVRLASRRPVAPDVLREVSMSSRWVTRYRVRLALVSNPFLEPAIAVKLAALLMHQHRRELAADHNLHPRVREFLDRSLRGPQDDILMDSDGLDDKTDEDLADS